MNLFDREKPIHIITVALLLIAVQIIVFAEYFGVPDRNVGSSQNRIACTEEAKLCPDGSSVGRTGPNCEFAECAKSDFAQMDTSTWKTYRNEEYGFEFKYPNELSVDIGNKKNGVTGEDIFVVNLKDTSNNSSFLSLETSCVLNQRLGAPFIHEELWSDPNSGMSSDNLDTWYGKFKEPISLQYTIPDFIFNVAGKDLNLINLGENKLFVFEQGCYECYDGWDEILQKNVANLEAGKDGFSMATCVAGLNDNGGKVGKCLIGITKRVPRMSEEFNEMEKVFLQGILPSLKLLPSFENVNKCEIIRLKG